MGEFPRHGNMQARTGTGYQTTAINTIWTIYWRNERLPNIHLLDPLNAPEPGEETGPGSHFTSTMTPARATLTSKGLAIKTKAVDSKYPSTPIYSILPGSASPAKSSFHPQIHIHHSTGSPHLADIANPEVLTRVRVVEEAAHSAKDTQETCLIHSSFNCEKRRRQPIAHHTWRSDIFHCCYSFHQEWQEWMEGLWNIKRGLIWWEVELTTVRSSILLINTVLYKVKLT